MSVKLIIWAIELQDIKPSEKLVLITATYYANRDHVARPTNRQLAEATGMARSTVSVALRGLAEKGLVSMTQNPRTISFPKFTREGSRP